MRVLDEAGNIIEDWDLELGKLVPESRDVTFRYEVTQQEQGHYEVTAEYPNGGKDVKWVIDVPELGRWVAYDEDGAEVETETVIPDDAPHEIEIPDAEAFYRYVRYTAEELAEKAHWKVQMEIGELKGKLADTDYVAAKAMDALLTCTDLAGLPSALASIHAEYSDVLEKREEWRRQINELEG